MTYANNNWRNLILTKNKGASWITYINLQGELYDYKLSQGSYWNNGEYPMMHIGQENGYVKMFGRNLVLKEAASENVNINGDVYRDICKGLTNTQAFFFQ